jgi:hypothetical protein
VNTPENTKLAKEFSSILETIVDSSFDYERLPHNWIESTTKISSPSFEKEIIHILSSAFIAVYETYPQADINSIVAKEFCFMLASNFETEIFARSDFEYFIEAASYPLLPVILRNVHVPIELVIERKVVNKIKSSKNNQKAKDVRYFDFRSRYEEIVKYHRDIIPECEYMSDEMVWKLTGVDL